VTKALSVSCPRCGAQMAWSPVNRYRPFCSERCKLIDLGAWATEKYRVPIEGEKDTPDTGELERGSGIEE
jgi:endogenous inhibitor of DNA gyrase (YacG/DUF329 family)